MQDESTKDMLFGVARLVSYISQTARLLPGDLVLTGSPAGNGIHWGRLLRDGDVMEGSITGLGAQRTRCVRGDAMSLDRRDPEGAIAEAAKAYSNWGRWGEDDVLGTLNFLDEAKRREGAALVRRGVSFSLSQRFDMNGPQKGWRRRTNPVHTMLDTGTDAALGNQGFPHGIGGADDVIAMPLAVLHPVGRARAHLRPRQGVERPGRREGRHLRRRPGHRHRAHGPVRRRARRPAGRGPGHR